MLKIPNPCYRLSPTLNCQDSNSIKPTFPNKVRICGNHEGLLMFQRSNRLLRGVSDRKQRTLLLLLSPFITSGCKFVFVKLRWGRIAPDSEDNLHGDAYWITQRAAICEWKANRISCATRFREPGRDCTSIRSENDRLRQDKAADGCRRYLLKEKKEMNTHDDDDDDTKLECVIKVTVLLCYLSKAAA